MQFVCTHLTPALTRARHEWQLHANSVTGVNEVIVCVTEPAAYADGLRRMFGKPAVRERKGEITALVEPITLRLSTFDADRQGHLINWGYALCDVSLRARVGLQVPMAAEWPVPEWPL